MDIGKSFGYIFQDKDWLKKILVGSAILVVSLPFTVVVIGFLGLAIVTGYTLEVLRNVRGGSTHPLPEWREKWSEWMILGLKLWLALFVWSLPALVLSGFNSLGNRLMWTDSDLLGLFGGLMVAVVACLSLLWWIVVALATPAISIRIAETGDVGTAFKVDSLYVFTKRHIGEVIIAVLVTIAASIAAITIGSLAGILLCFVGWIITIPAAVFISNLISVHLYAQIGMNDSFEPQPVVEPSAPPTGSSAQAPVQDTRNTLVVAPDGSIVVTPSDTLPNTAKTSGR